MEGKILIEIREGDVIIVYGMEDTDSEGDVILVYGREILIEKGM